MTNNRKQNINTIILSLLLSTNSFAYSLSSSNYLEDITSQPISIDQEFIDAIGNEDYFRTRHLNAYFVELGFNDSNFIDNSTHAINHSPLDWLQQITDSLQSMDDEERLNSILWDIANVTELYLHLLNGVDAQLELDCSNENKLIALAEMMKLFLFAGNNEVSIETFPLSIDYSYKAFKPLFTRILAVAAALPGSDELGTPQSEYLDNLRAKIQEIEDIIACTDESGLSTLSKQAISNRLLILIFQAINVENFVNFIPDEHLSQIILIVQQSSSVLKPKIDRIHQAFYTDATPEEKLDSIIEIFNDMTTDSELANVQ